jgi:C4-dicarboxylate-specific signal transduction histidine kinase
LPRLVAFVICAVVANVVSTRQKRVENALRVARDELERTVRERTAELQSANASLSAEAALHENSRFLVKTQSFRSGKNYLRAAGADP